jgi:methylmalonyl-CoA/ethylmalonyl-CoA epimerase
MLTFHHIGIAVSNIDRAAESYIKIFGADCLSEKYHVTSQQVNVQFVSIPDNALLELIEPTSESSSIHNLLKKNISYYHVGYLTEDIDREIAELTSQGFMLISEFNSEAFAGRKCAFLFSPVMHLFELIQKP